MSEHLWQVELVGTRAALAAAVEPAWEAGALAVSLFEDAPDGLETGACRLSVLLGTTTDPARFAAAIGLPPHSVDAHRRLPSVNWVAKSLEGLPAVDAGRFRVRGSHVRRRRGGCDLLIEAGEAFGSGHHGTTRGCLLAFDALLKSWSPSRVLDLGCGAGVLAIAAAKTAPEAQIVASDIDPVAVAVTAENAELNGVGGRIVAVEAAGLSTPLLRGAGFDLVFANILAGPLIELAADIADSVDPGGRLILSGLLQPQARAVSAAYRARGLVRERTAVLEGWSTLTLMRP